MLSPAGLASNVGLAVRPGVLRRWVLEGVVEMLTRGRLRAAILLAMAGLAV